MCYITALCCDVNIAAHHTARCLICRSYVPYPGSTEKQNSECYAVKVCRTERRTRNLPTAQMTLVMFTTH